MREPDEDLRKELHTSRLLARRKEFEVNPRRVFFELQPHLARRREALLSESGEMAKMVDREVLSERLTLLGEYLEDLEELQGLTYDEFLQDKRVRRYVERTLQLAMECCLDLASHIIADLKLREPESYRDMFAVLAENSIVGRENLDALQKMAQLRNVLVRNYTRIDPEIVFGVLKRNIETFREFGRQVNALL